MTSGWILKKIALFTSFSLFLIALHWAISEFFVTEALFKEALIIHLFLYIISTFIFIVARKINDHNPTYTTEIMLGANASKMLLGLGFFLIIYLLKSETLSFAYSFVAIYFMYLAFNAYMYIKHFKLPL